MARHDTWLFASAVARAPSPCAEFHCSKVLECAEQRLACDAFVSFVACGVLRRPEYQITGTEAVRDDEADETARKRLQIVGMNTGPQPTREKYAVLFPRERQG